MLMLHDDETFDTAQLTEFAIVANGDCVGLILLIALLLFWYKVPLTATLKLAIKRSHLPWFSSPAPLSARKLNEVFCTTNVQKIDFGGINTGPSIDW